MSAPPHGWMDEVRALVEHRLRSFFEAKRSEANALASEGRELVDALGSLTLRGGKRLRPAVLMAGFRAIDASRPFADVAAAAAALELFQTYLLIHDDWMDQDDERRGGPSVHTALGAAHGDGHLGDALAILAGDLSSAYAWELLLLEQPASAPMRERATRVFLRMQQEVVIGQQLDLLASADVGRMQQLKTGSYTVRGPLALGAVLAGADEAQTNALERFGGPLGEAFQIRDDLLGAFGDPRCTGKPRGSDLTSGRRNALVREAEASLDAEGREALRRELVAAEPDPARLLSLFQVSGAREAAEARLSALVEEAKGSLERARLSAAGVALLTDLAERLTRRER